MNKKTYTNIYLSKGRVNPAGDQGQKLAQWHITDTRTIGITG